MADLRLRSLITGAEAVEPELAAWARHDLGLSNNNAFGQTEANALIGHAHVLGDLDPGCLGRPYPGHEVAILDPEQRPVPAGTVGEIAVRADDAVCMLGYWNAPEATAAKFRNGWLVTGDFGQFDEAGNLHFHGRADDLIKSGGYRIGPGEIEATLYAHPAVADCAVVGVPDPVRGQEVVAYVVLAAGHDADPELTVDLQARVRRQVGAHAYPRRVEYVAALTKTSTGKVDRRALRVRADVPALRPEGTPT
jgi:acetyl-CoA synthetase